MEKERRLAASGGTPDPIRDSFEATSRMYQKSLEYLLGKASVDLEKYFLMVATHNEDSVTNALERYIDAK